MAPTLSFSCAAAGSTPLFSAASPPTSASDHRPECLGGWVLTQVIAEDACSAASAEASGQYDAYFPAHRPGAQYRGDPHRAMIYIGLPQWSHPKWVRLVITSLEEYAATLVTAWRATPPAMRYPSRRLSPAGTNRLTMTSASASNFRPPSRTRPPCAIATS